MALLLQVVKRLEAALQATDEEGRQVECAARAAEVAQAVEEALFGAFSKCFPVACLHLGASIGQHPGCTLRTLSTLRTLLYTLSTLLYTLSTLSTCQPYYSLPPRGIVCRGAPWGPPAGSSTLSMLALSTTPQRLWETKKHVLDVARGGERVCACCRFFGHPGHRAYF
jgi:hypothetical protein